MKNKSLKIIHIIPTLQTGGAERFLVDLVIEQKKQGHRPEVICLRAGGNFFSELKQENIEIIILHAKSKLVFLSIFKLIKIIKQQKPDIIHAHLFGGILYGGLAAYLSGVRDIISTEQNINQSDFFVRKLFRILAACFSKKYVAVSSAVGDYAVKELKVAKGKVVVIPNGVVCDKFLHSHRSYFNKINFTVGGLGRLVEQKGFDVLINAAEILKNEPVNFVIAGSGLLDKKLARQIKTKGLENKVVLVGATNQPAEFLQSVDIFAMPSYWEGFGIVLLEAGLSGLPVVASNIGGIKDIINEKIGKLIEPGNAEMLAKNIKQLITDESLREKLGKALQKKVINNFSIQSVAKQYENLYFEAIG